MSEVKTLMQRLREDCAARTKHEILGVEIYTTRLTVGEQMTLREREPESRARYMVEMLLMKCTLEDGTPAFTRDDKDDLLQRVAGDRLTPLISAITGPGVEEQAKN